jgi:hypothetical protein
MEVFWGGFETRGGFETQRHRGTEKDRGENRERPEKRVGERKSRGVERRGSKKEGVKKGITKWEKMGAWGLVTNLGPEHFLVCRLPPCLCDSVFPMSSFSNVLFSRFAFSQAPRKSTLSKIGMGNHTNGPRRRPKILSPVFKINLSDAF